jgi:hypothetical protein
MPFVVSSHLFANTWTIACFGEFSLADRDRGKALQRGGKIPSGWTRGSAGQRNLLSCHQLAPRVLIMAQHTKTRKSDTRCVD